METVWLTPTEISTYRSAVGGGSDQVPQQITLPLDWRPHVAAVPADTRTNFPFGTVVCPALFCPQQDTVPSLPTPQV
jgi:hypothetical protein